MIYSQYGLKVKITEAIEANPPGNNTGHYLIKIKNIETNKDFLEWKAIHELRADKGGDEIESAIKEVLLDNEKLSEELKETFIALYPNSLKKLGS